MSIKNFRGRIEEYEEHSQAPDAKDIPRFAQELGKTVSKEGRSVWTSLFIYAQEPTLEHPFNIKIALHNKKGHAFTQLQLKEFDKLISDLTLWRASVDPGLKRCSEKNDRLLRNKSYVQKLTDIMSSTEYSAPPEIIVDGVNVTEQSIQREKEIILKMLSNLPNSSNKAFLIKDILSRLDELQNMDIDISDIEESLQSMIDEMEKERNYRQTIQAKSYESQYNRVYNKFIRKEE